MLDRGFVDKRLGAFERSEAENTRGTKREVAADMSNKESFCTEEPRGHKGCNEIAWVMNAVERLAGSRTEATLITLDTGR